MDILRTVYEEVTTLENWLKNLTDLDIDNEEYSACLRELHNIYVAFASCRKFFKPVSLSQHSHQYEIILRTVQRILRQKWPGQNVLTFGFSRICEGSTGQVWQNIESKYPNSSVKLLQSMPWKNLLTWIGDEMMLYILEHLSIFLEARPSCFVQLSGTPIYEMWSFDTGSVLKLHKNSQRNHDSRNQKKRKLEECEMPDAKRKKTSSQSRKILGEDELSQTSCKNTESRGSVMDIEGLPLHDEIDEVHQNKHVDKDNNLTFKPYNSKLILPRNKLLYNVNIRERVPKSASMVKHQPTSDGILALYTDIFIKNDDNGIKNDKVIVPSLTTKHIDSILKEKSFNREETDDDNVETVEPDDREMAESTRTNVYVTVSNGQRIYVGSHLKVIHLLKRLLQNARRLPYKVLANHHCSININGNKSDRRPNKTKGFCKKPQPWMSLLKLLNQHSHNRKVFLFLRACLLCLLPVQLVGGATNRNLILKKMSMLISMGKYDKLSLGQLMTGLKTKEIDWLHDITSNSCRLYLLSRLVYWLFVNVIFVLLRTMFYITDTTFLRYKILYYRQIVWSKITSQGLKDLLKKRTLKPMTKLRVQEFLNSKASLGTSNLRFLPKQKSLRPIVNMGVVDSELVTQKLSINKQLTDLHLLLTYIKDKNPSLIGFGKLGTDDIYMSWISFVEKWREMGETKLYFVKTDISRCYDSILQHKLCDIMKKIFEEELGEEDLIVTRYVAVTSRKGVVTRRFQRKVFSLCEFEPNIEKHCLKLLERQRNTIVVDKMCHSQEIGEKLLRILDNHVSMNIIKFACKYYLHTEGISQGSVLSTLLCSFYYADMERNHFELKDGEFMIRIVDDYMYVTPDLKNAERFLSQMLEGIPEYNCSTNIEKVCVNFEYEDDPNITVLNEDWFPWCGMLFNTKTLEVTNDYDRYVGKSITDTMSIDLTSNPGTALKEKLVYSVSQKCHKIFTDGTINSEEQIIRNIFHLFIFATLQFHAFVRKLPFKRPGGVTYRLLIDIINCLTRTVQKKVRYTKNSGKLTEEPANKVIQWLCVHAFVVKFSECKAQYNVLLKPLKQWEKSIEKNMMKDKIKQLVSLCGVKVPEKFTQMLT